MSLRNQRIKSIFPPHVDTGHIDSRVSDKPPASNIILEKGEGSFLGSKNSIILRFSLYILLHRGIVWCAGSFLIPPIEFCWYWALNLNSTKLCTCLIYIYMYIVHVCEVFKRQIYEHWSWCCLDASRNIKRWMDVDCVTMLRRSIIYSEY